MRAGIALAVLFLTLGLSQPISAAECIPEDQLTEEDKYIGKLKDKCVKSIHGKGNFNLAELHDGTLIIYNSSGQPVSLVPSQLKKDTKNYGYEPEIPKDITDLINLARKVSYEEDFSIRDTATYEYLNRIVALPYVGNYPAFFWIGSHGNRYKSAVENLIGNVPLKHVLDFYDGYINSIDEPGVDTPALEEKLTALQKLYSHLEQYLHEIKNKSLYGIEQTRFQMAYSTRKIINELDNFYVEPLDRLHIDIETEWFRNHLEATQY